MTPEILAALRAARVAGRPVALVTHIGSGAQRLVGTEQEHGTLPLPPADLAAARTALADDRSGLLDGEAGRLFVHVYNPPLRLIIVGAVHIAQPLVGMAQLAGYAVTLVDPRRAFATDARFPGLDLRSDWPDEALNALRPDRRTAVVTLTHDPKLDDPALLAALRSPAFYIGALGSRRTHAARLDRLRQGGLGQGGLGEAELARIHGPVGLPIGAKSPAEIALSILAQITLVHHRDAAAASQPAAAAVGGGPA